jgi:hypothetical protein
MLNIKIPIIFDYFYLINFLTAKKTTAPTIMCSQKEAKNVLTFLN